MPDDKLTKKEEEIIEVLNTSGQVQMEDIKALEKLAKKLEKVLGKSDMQLI